MSLGSIYYGDLTVLSGYDTVLHGLGDLRVGNKAIIGITNTISSINASTGNLIVNGGLAVGENIYINKNLNVIEQTILGRTTINNLFLVSNTSSSIISSGSIILSSDSSGTLITSTLGNINISGKDVISNSLTSTSIYSNNLLSLESTTGINIGTLNNTPIPVVIGSLGSDTTIRGNLNVKGTTTTYDSTVMTIKDNFIQVNNQPTTNSTVDGGLAIKRFQPANENVISSLSGEIINDTPAITGIVVNWTTGNNNLIINTTSSSLNTTIDYYKGYWVKLTYNSIGWVRRVKSSVTSNTGGNLTLYTTSDQTNLLGNPVPTEGLNLPTSGSFAFPTFPVTSGNISLDMYGSHWILSMWDESNKEYAIVSSNNVLDEAPANYSNVSINDYSNFHANRLTGKDIITNTVNGSVADVQFLVTLSNNTTPVTLTTIGSTPTTFTLSNYGSYLISVKPTTTTDTSPFAIFSGARRNKSTACGNINRIASVVGENNEMLDMDWPANSYPRLKYTITPGTIGNVQFSVKVTSV